MDLWRATEGSSGLECLLVAHGFCFLKSEIVVIRPNGFTDHMQGIMGLTFAKIILDSGEISKAEVDALTGGKY